MEHHQSRFRGKTKVRDKADKARPVRPRTAPEKTPTRQSMRVSIHSQSVTADPMVNRLRNLFSVQTPSLDLGGVCIQLPPAEVQPLKFCNVKFVPTDD